MTTIIIGCILLGIFLFTFSVGKRETLSNQSKKKVLRLWEMVHQFDDPNQKILEAEKVVDVLFKEMDLRGSFAEKLKTMNAYIPDKEYVWAAHKLRNRIAHEAGFKATGRDAKHAVKAFGKVIQKYCK